MNNWQPIRTAPKEENSTILGCAKIYNEWVIEITTWQYWAPQRYWASYSFDRFGPQPTHWIPLPDPPREGKS